MTSETSKKPQAAAEVPLEKVESSHDRITLRQKPSSERGTPQHIYSNYILINIDKIFWIKVWFHYLV
ncbi:hypothetical protein AYI69_g477 [Smittium culicis]|uniref:Uncharacterized protein n=1 Tax=Smittium culicis TaxID=133412 RepID=A0A1R1YSX6_9FUNG|nr:hypothetical protein AYI69_g477 [Smittium culicis]